MKKTIFAALYLVLVMSVELMGCGKSEPKEQEQEKSKIEISAPGQFPITNEKVTLNVLVRGNELIENLETNEFTKYFEELTGVQVKWDVAPVKNGAEKLNLTLGSGDLPDVILDMGVTNSQLMIYGQQGVFLPLNDLIEEYGVEFKKVMAEVPSLKDAITAPDGNIYSLPKINDCYHCTMSQKVWIYQPWLDKLDLEMPTTTEEFYQVLKAFKENDPNGNKMADEIPFASSITGGYSGIDGFFMSAFILNDMMSDGLYVNNGKIEANFDKQEWKEGLQFLHKLYSEGLIAPETFTQDVNQLRKIGEDPQGVRIGVAAGLTPGNVTQLGGESGRWLEYKALPPLKGPSGLQTTLNKPRGIVNGTFIITKEAKHPEIAFRWADALYSFENTLRSTVGRPDIEWRNAKEGEIGINGEPAVWTSLKQYGSIQNVNWSQNGPSYRPDSLRLGAAVEDENDLEVVLFKATKEAYEPYKSDVSMALPQLYFTNEQAAELADLQKTIVDYKKEMFARFITGDAGLDKEWDNYLKTLKNMKLDRFLTIQQEAYDAKYNK